MNENLAESADDKNLRVAIEAMQTLLEMPDTHFDFDCSQKAKAATLLDIAAQQISLYRSVLEDMAESIDTLKSHSDTFLRQKPN